MKKLVMFDMDGVLFDSMPYHAMAWRKTMLHFGYDFPESTFYMHEGRTGKSTISILLGHEAAEKEWREYYSHKSAIFDSFPEAPVMPGAEDVVDAVRFAGVPATIVTGSGQHKLLDRIGRSFPGGFRTEWMVTSADVKNGKPSPEPYLQGLSKAGVAAGESVVIENAPLGVRSGHVAGCYVVAVNTGPLPDSVLLDEGADVLYHSMTELSSDIDKILSL